MKIMEYFLAVGAIFFTIIVLIKLFNTGAWDSLTALWAVVFFCQADIYSLRRKIEKIEGK
jgi:hypothetical protein